MWGDWESDIYFLHVSMYIYVVEWDAKVLQ